MVWVVWFPKGRRFLRNKKLRKKIDFPHKTVDIHFHREILFTVLAPIYLMDVCISIKVSKVFTPADID